MLSTFVKLAYREGYSTAEATAAQLFWAVLVMSALGKLTGKGAAKPTPREIQNLILAGTSLGFTSVMYYVSVRFLNANIAVVFLMQSIWMGVVFECVNKRVWPTLNKILAVVFVLFGTLLATNALSRTNAHLDIRGVIFGLLAAVSFTATLAASGVIAPHLAPVKRSQFMLYGGAAVVAIFVFLTQIGPYYLHLNLVGDSFAQAKPFDFRILFSYGLLLSLFGMIVPPFMLNKGFPITGVGLGSIISSVELPFAAAFAYVLLGEALQPLQMLGIAIIITAVCLVNYRELIRDS